MGRRGLPYCETPFTLRPAWRWERANYLIAHGMYASSVRDDAPTCELVRFRRAQLRAVTDRQQNATSARSFQAC